MSSEACPMVGGDGSQSYSENSSFQKMVMDIAKKAIKESIENNLDFNNPYFGSVTLNTFKITDFGCSVGPNTFHAMEILIEAVDQKYKHQFQNPTTPLEFQVFFSDLTGNDFNTLFKSLPPHRNYFAAGVPGSFYTRLFPKSTLHVGFTSYALHWLSKVPEEIMDKNSKAWNKGCIQCSGYNEEVARAYLGQFRVDVETFLNARAQEIVKGGLLVIIVAGRPNGVLMSQTATGASNDLLGTCMAEAAKSGMVKEEVVDSFNLPIYYATPMELEDIITHNAYFNVVRMGESQHPMTMEGMKPTPKFASKTLRAVLEGVVKKHFQNDGFLEKVFNGVDEKFVENWNNLSKMTQQTELFAVLQRTSN